MRISFFNYHYDITGSARGAAAQVSAIAAGLTRLGHQVDVQFRGAKPSEALRPYEALKRMSWARRYGNVPRLLLRNLSFFRHERRLLAAFQPDVLLAINSYCNVSALLAARSRRLPFVLFTETPLEYEYSLFFRQYYSYPRLGRWIEGLNVRRADQVTCISEILKGYMMRYDVSATKLHVIPNGVDHHAFCQQPADEELRTRLHLHGRQVIGFVGTFNFFAPIEAFIEVIKGVCERHPQVVFLFVGQGKASERLRQVGEQYGLHECLIFTGAAPHTQVPQYLSVMDIVLCPYRGDYLFYGSSMKLLEYMAAGKAIVATALGQIKEVICDGYNGLLCEWDDTAALQRKLLALIEDEGLRRRLGANARTTIEKEWTWDMQMSRLAKILELTVESH